MKLLRASLFALISTYLLMLLLVLLDGIEPDLVFEALLANAYIGSLALLLTYILWILPAHLLLK